MTWSGHPIGAVDPTTVSDEGFAHFVATGVLGTAVGLGLHAAIILSVAGAQTALASLTALAVLLNVATISWFVFRARGSGRSPWYMVAYAAIWTEANGHEPSDLTRPLSVESHPAPDPNMSSSATAQEVTTP